MTSKPASPHIKVQGAAPVAPLQSVSAQLFERGLNSSTLVNTLGQEIVSGFYEAGALLPNEAAMREKYGVSRTALREAYSKLTAKGLVVARPKVGTSVRRRQHWNMLDQEVLAWHLQSVPAGEIAQDLYALRRMIEPSAAEMAAEFRTQADIEALYAALEAMNSNTSIEADLVEADFSFHVAGADGDAEPLHFGLFRPHPRRHALDLRIELAGCGSDQATPARPTPFCGRRDPRQGHWPRPQSDAGTAR